MEKMIMEGKLASELMDCLACLYLSAYGDGTIDTYYELTERLRNSLVRSSLSWQMSSSLLLVSSGMLLRMRRKTPLRTTNPMTSTVIADTTPTWVALRTTADAVVFFF